MNDSERGKESLMHHTHVVKAVENRTGTVSYIFVMAKDSAHARRLFEATYGSQMRVLRVDRER